MEKEKQMCLRNWQQHLNAPWEPLEGTSGVYAWVQHCDMAQHLEGTVAAR
jgi:hypothetical protein